MSSRHPWHPPPEPEGVAVPRQGVEVVAPEGVLRAVGGGRVLTVLEGEGGGAL